MQTLNVCVYVLAEIHNGTEEKPDPKSLATFPGSKYSIYLKELSHIYTQIRVKAKIMTMHQTQNSRGNTIEIAVVITKEYMC